MTAYWAVFTGLGLSFYIHLGFGSELGKKGAGKKGAVPLQHRQRARSQDYSFPDNAGQATRRAAQYAGDLDFGA